MIMKDCPGCKKANPDDLEFCRYCGRPLPPAPFVPPKKPRRRLPSWVWILIIIAGAAGLIGLLIGSFVGIAMVEGFASVILLLCGIVGFGIYPLRKPEKANPFTRAIGLSFFALMGAAVDQPGNFIYNKPVEICFCESGTSLNRTENVSNPLPGTTYIEQNYICYDAAGNPVKRINVFAVVAIRFVEYVLLGYLLLWLRRVIWSRKNKT